MLSAPDRQAPRTARFGGLDGLRAIAVALVLWYHFWPASLPGGFLGVDVFFVISGFLITSLLLREHETRGRIALAAFWRRRARRLLPALTLVLLVSTSLGALVGGDVLVGIGAQLAGAAFFVSNWVFIANGADYFARDTPELFRNTWSLSIEEQFYILLPLLILLLLRLRSRATRALPLLALAAVSSLLMLRLSMEGADPTRVYFGSDSHTFGLFIGAAMAVLLHRAAHGPGFDVDGDAGSSPGLGRQFLYAAVAVAGLGVLGWQAATLVEGSAASFRGGFQLATAASLAVVWAVTRPGAAVGRALDARPLRWVGERSYGIYLWHWPLLVVCTAAAKGSPIAAAAPWAVPVVALVSTVVLAAASHRFIEQPVRRFGLRRSIRLALQPGSYTPLRRSVAIGIAALLALTVPATGIAIANAPEQSSAEAAIARGQRAVDDREKDAPAAEADEHDGREPGDAEGKTGSGSTGSGSDGEAKQAGNRATGGDIDAVGDSVMLASLPELESSFPGIRIDAEVSRGLSVGVGIARDLSAGGDLRRVLVVGLGTNGPVDPDDLAAMRETAGDRGLVLVNAHADREWIPGVNDALKSFADAHRGVVVADWDGAVTGVADALAGDDIHPNPSGGEIYASSVQRAIDALDRPGEAVGFRLPRR